MSTEQHPWDREDEETREAFAQKDAEIKRLRELLDLEKAQVQFEQKEKLRIEGDLRDTEKAKQIAPGLWLQDQELIWEGEPDEDHDCDQMGCMTLRHAIRRKSLAQYVSESTRTSEPSHDGPSVRDRIKVGDLVNHHGFLCVVTEKAESSFTYETLSNGQPTGEAFTMRYESMAEKDPKPCWRTE